MFLLLAACGQPEPPTPVAPVVAPDTMAHAVRASMAVRGQRPTEAELTALQEDPGVLPSLVDTWLTEDAFGEVIKDIHAEWLLVRADVVDPLPALGVLEGELMYTMSRSLAEAPLELVRHVVMNDLPYTEVVTSETTMANPIVAGVYGTDYDPKGPEWQLTHWSDGRPHAGLLSDSELWRRHESAGSNFNRLRANLIADVFLCEDFASRDIVVEGGITISDEFEVADAVRTIPECVNCHQALDPLAAYFWGFKKQTRRSTVKKGFANNCNNQPSDDPFIPYAEVEYCYPLEIYSTEDEDWWQYWELPAPGFYGTPGVDLTDLGASIAADPRFAQCAARRFYGWMTQSYPDDLPLAEATQLQGVLTDSGFSAKTLVRAIVLSDSFRDAPLQIVRPEQYAHTIEAITGFEWRVNPDLPGCDAPSQDGTDCWGQVELMRSDKFGYRAMAGGINGNEITRPVHAPTPVRELVSEAYASQAAGFVVAADLAQPDRVQRTLLTTVEADTTDEAAIRDQIAALSPTILSAFLEPDGDEVGALYALWRGKYDRNEDPAQAWSLVLTAMFLDPRVMFF